VIRVFIADDHSLVRAGFRELLAGSGGMKVVGEAADGDDTLAQLRQTTADVLLLDIGMPGPGVLHLLQRIAADQPRLRVLVVSMYPENQIAVQAIEAGAAGYLSKNQSPGDLIAAVRKVYGGGRYVSEQLGERLAAELYARRAGNGRPRLSQREHQILVSLGKGRTLKEIAGVLTVSPKTVSTYRGRILQKLGLKTNADLVRYVIDNSLAP
jgi:DNA-binding NarL/FixJ family response regulator